MAAKVGLTGGIGSGKTTVTKLFAEQGVPIVDADAIAHQLTRSGTPALAKIASHFGKNLLRTDGSLDRALLRQRVFYRESERLWLENLLHPLIRTEMNRQAEHCRAAYCILDIPLLVETGRQHDMDYVIVVHCPRELRITRLITTRNMPKQDIKRIMAQQATDYERLAAADFVLVNDAGPEALETHFRRAFSALTSRFGAINPAVC